MKFRTLAIVAFTTLIFSLPAHAMDLDEARRRGFVGETMNGYVEQISGGQEIENLVEDINRKRRAQYEKISQENGQDMSVVEKLAAKQIISRLDEGYYYKTKDGKWETR